MEFSGHLWNVPSIQWELWLARCLVFLSRVWPLISWVHCQPCSKSHCITGSHSCLSVWPSDSECSADLWGCPILSWPFSDSLFCKFYFSSLEKFLLHHLTKLPDHLRSTLQLHSKKNIQNDGGIMGSPPWFLLWNTVMHCRLFNRIIVSYILLLL